MSILLWYVLPLVVCILGCWFQNYMDDDDDYDLAFLGFVPLFNIILAASVAVVALGWLVYRFVTLPRIIKNYTRKPK
jgi:peptidoglycan/LPS O-acetylase OafA/YrhL